MTVKPKMESTKVPTATVITFKIYLGRCTMSNATSPLLWTLSTSIELPSFCWKYQSLRYNEKLLGSHRSRSDSSSLVFVTWNCKYFGPVFIPVTDNEIVRPARINSFLSHTITFGGTNLNHILISLSWFQFHPQVDYFGKPLSVWCHDLFEGGSHITIFKIPWTICTK